MILVTKTSYLIKRDKRNILSQQCVYVCVCVCFTLTDGLLTLPSSSNILLKVRGCQSGSRGLLE